MSPRYAENTAVTSEQSRAEIERTLARYGANSFMYGWDGEQAIIRFRMNDRLVEFRLPLPARDAREFTHTPGRQLERSPAEREKAWEQAVKQRWRALALAVKAKLEAVEAGIAEFEDEFLAHIVLPGGETVGQATRARIAEAYKTGKMHGGLLELPGAAGTS